MLRIRLSWFLCVRSRQALLLVELLLLLLLLLEAVPMKPPPLGPLSTKGTRAWQRCTRSARSIQTWNLEGQKYLTSSMAIPIIEELRESLRSTRMYRSTLLLTLLVASRFWRTSLRVSTSVLAKVLTSPSCVRATAVNLADIPRCVAQCVLFWVTFNCVYF